MPKLDREMLEWTGAGDEARLMSSCSTTMPSEYAYGPGKWPAGHQGRHLLTRTHGRGEEEGLDRHSMKNDWKRIFPEGDR